jgi:oligopeptide/dipeptide ABC transporter ATP-binding protein
MTARAILRLLPAGARLSGAIRFDGADVVQMGRRQLRHHRSQNIGIVFQDPRSFINPIRTVGDFMSEALVYNQGVKRSVAMKRCAELLDEVGISDPEARMRQLPLQMSGGMLQRVMVAAACAVDPKLLIADEATTALDVTTQAEVVDVVKTQQRARGMALLFITHDLDLAMAICDRVIVMYAGTVVEDSPVEHLAENPLHPYAAALMASRPRLRDPTERLATIPGQAVAPWEIGAGCAFAPRCAHVRECCLRVTPERRSVSGRLVACHVAGEIGPKPRGVPGRHA